MRLLQTVVSGIGHWLRSPTPGELYLITSYSAVCKGSHTSFFGFVCSTHKNLVLFGSGVCNVGYFTRPAFDSSASGGT